MQENASMLKLNTVHRKMLISKNKPANNKVSFNLNLLKTDLDSGGQNAYTTESKV